MATVTINKMDLQNNTTRTVYVTWSWDQSNTEHYKVKWYYATGDGVSFVGSDTTTTAKQSVYNAPENATKVKVRIKPVSKKKKVNGKETSYWTAEWSTDQWYYFSSNPPEMPPLPTVTIEDCTLTAKIDYMTGTANDGVEVQFQVVKDDRVTSDLTPYKTGTVRAFTHQATYTTTIELGHRYKVRCRAIKGDQYSKWTEYTKNVETIPSATNIKEYSGGSNKTIYVSWDAATGAETYTLEYATVESYLGASNASTTVSGINSLVYTITGIESGKTYYIRVKGVNAQGDSGWSNVVSVIVGKKPEPPTTWSSTTTAMVGEDVILHWVHNAEDGSKQRYAMIEIDDGEEVASYRVTNENLNLDEEDDKNRIGQMTLKTTGYKEGCKIKWRVKTAGIFEEYSDWSMQRTIDVYAPPTLTLEVTDGSGSGIEKITSFPLYLKGTAGPKTQTPIGYHVSIISNEPYTTVDEVGNTQTVSKGDEVFSKFYDISEDLLLELNAGSITLENNISYTINCMVTMDSGLSTNETRVITVSWSEVMYNINAEIGYDKETLSVFINPYCEDAKGVRMDSVTLSVYRKQYDGSFVELATGLSNVDNVFVTDPHPSLDYARYRIVAVDKSNGSVSYYDLPGYPIGETAIIIQWGEQWSNFYDVGDTQQEQPIWSGSVLKLPYNIDVSDSNNLDVALVKYIGRTRPISYYGTQIESTATWNVEIIKSDKETLYGLRRLSNWMGDVYVREPSGSGYWASIQVSFNQTHCALTIPVTLTLTRVEGGI